MASVLKLFILLLNSINFGNLNLIASDIFWSETFTFIFGTLENHRVTQNKIVINLSVMSNHLTHVAYVPLFSSGEIYRQISTFIVDLK